MKSSSYLVIEKYYAIIIIIITISSWLSVVKCDNYTSRQSADNMHFECGLSADDNNRHNNTEYEACCVRKCCQPGQSITSDLKCLPIKADGDPFRRLLKRIELYEIVDGRRMNILNDSLQDEPNLIYGIPCNMSFTLNPNNDTYERFYLSKTGSRLNGEILDSEKDSNWYCLDSSTDDDNDYYMIAIICITADDVTRGSTKTVNALYPISLTVSVPFLMITFLVYGYVDELRNLHGKSLMSHVATLTVGYVFLILIQTHTYYETHKNFCVLSAVIVQFSLLGSFFWLNAMCFDLWWTFCGYRSFSGLPKERDGKKFILYSIYAWGCPTAITSFTLLVEFCPGLSDLFVKPTFGETTCWFQEKRGILYYFYGPIGLLLICNTLMFISTNINIMKHRKDEKILKRTGSRRHSHENEQRRLSVCFKLFIVMGMNWIMEIVSWAFEDLGYVWYFTDVGNGLQGVLIFYIFVLKRRVWRLLKRKICPVQEKSRTISCNSTSVTSNAFIRIPSKNSMRNQNISSHGEIKSNNSDFVA